VQYILKIAIKKRMCKIRAFTHECHNALYPVDITISETFVWLLTAEFHFNQRRQPLSLNSLKE